MHIKSFILTIALAGAFVQPAAAYDTDQADMFAPTQSTTEIERRIICSPLVKRCYWIG